MNLQINEATILLVAEILRQERKVENLPVEDATTAIKAAVRTMSDHGRPDADASEEDVA